MPVCNRVSAPAFIDANRLCQSSRTQAKKEHSTILLSPDSRLIHYLTEAKPAK
jgi:hypothetical protein